MADDLFRIASDDRQLHTDLAAADLPVSDLGKAEQIVWRLGLAAEARGYVAIETHGRYALLRSLLVMPRQRGRGQARTLVAVATEHARAMDIDELWLLTNTAAGLFERLGWTRRDRSAAPDVIAASGEFSNLCPSSAVCFSRRIKS
jgi:amino-acid N-acetyltransferase